MYSPTKRFTYKEICFEVRLKKNGLVLYKELNGNRPGRSKGMVCNAQNIDHAVKITKEMIQFTFSRGIVN